MSALELLEYRGVLVYVEVASVDGTVADTEVMSVCGRAATGVVTTML
jgi:hypothetical protein